jgi:alpha-1,2-mannosyltransferase
VAFGCGVAVKFWAAFPAAVLLAACLIARPPAETSRARRAGALVGGAVGGFAVLAGPFALADPSGFFRETVLEQVSRVGSYTPISLRLAHLTGLIDVLGRDGKVAAPGTTTHSLFAMGAEASTHTVAVGWPAYAAAAAGIALIAAGYLRGIRQRTPLEWFALATAVLATAAVMYYSAFFYHYPDFPAPWLAIAVGAAVASLACLITGTAGRARLARRVLAAAVAVVILAVAGIEARELDPAHVPPSPANVSALVPAGSCLVADQVSFAIAANRFAAPSQGCPDVIDSLAVTLALSGGVSPQGGAGHAPNVVAGWEAVFGKAKYVWLSGGASARIPWTPALQTWFSAHFRLLASYPDYGASRLYVHD